MSATPDAVTDRTWAIRLNRIVYWLSSHWLLSTSVLIGLWVGLPWLAPLFIEIGWTGAGKAIYLLYAAQCHQLPQRSFFLFGRDPMYSLSQIQAAWRNTNNPLILRQFTGNVTMGWKVAWSDRMVYMYATILLWGVFFWPLRKRLKALPWWGLVILWLPLAIDGFSHTISDFTAGIGLGFRDSNAWLAVLTDNAFPASFYSGDALGSFNSWMRMLSGVLFSLGLVWAFYPRLQSSFANTAWQITEKIQAARLNE